ncbi:MAG: hypothetical protein COZ06_08925 [Armatimonadetes bacterium CG_4_10_14_3_um_filter_66_18]|nr:MAG: hypothetical protein COZ06_08925 [Armatimonadetes bacterium CG_4_10_14_3_um_filter_66_18]
MSHFTTIRTELRDKEALKKALADLGYAVREGALHARGYGGQTTPVELLVPQEGGYDFGFRKAGDVYELVADFWGLKLDQQRFVPQLTQRYAFHTIVDTTAQQGWNVAQQEQQQDGTIRVVVQRWR